MSVGAATAITIPESALPRIASDVIQYGSRGLETGGFLLGDAADRISHVALAGMKGIIRRRDQFAVSGLSLDRLFTWAAEHQLFVPAQFHSHGGHHGQRPFLSTTDQEHGFRVEGFISSVIPGFANPPLQPAAWGWWQFGGQRWVEVRPAAVGPGTVSFVMFDEDGVRGA